MTETAVEPTAPVPGGTPTPEAPAQEGKSNEVVMEFAGPPQTPEVPPVTAVQPAPTASVVPTSSHEPPPPVDEEVLDLTSLIPTRKLIKLPTTRHPEGEPFELRLLDDFGLIDQQKLLSWSKRFEQLWNSETGRDLVVEEQDVLLNLLNGMFEMILRPAHGMTDEEFRAVKAELPDHIKSRVVTAFSYVPLVMRREAEARAEAREAAERQKMELPNQSEPTTES